MPIKYVTGDATKPVGDGPKLILHVCNDIGKWGSGFVLAVSQRSSFPEILYRKWAAGDSDSDKPFVLGQIQACAYLDNCKVINMIAQRGIGNMSFKCKGKIEHFPAIRYDSLAECLYRVVEYAHSQKFLPTIHAPKLGAGLAGGSWNRISAIMTGILINFGGLDVTVYELP